MITGLIALLVCQVVGELVVRTLDLRLPGPIAGMVLMFVVLQVRNPRPTSGLVRGPRALLRHLPLLYVPAGVGVVAYLSPLGSAVLPVTVGLAASWLAGLVVTAGGTALVLRLTRSREVVR
jgi:holin-like protein